MKTSDFRVRLQARGCSPLQGGQAPVRWVLTVEPLHRLFIEPLMGWTGSRDPVRGLELTFSDPEQARPFARRQGWEVEQVPVHQPKRPTRTYADDFRWDLDLLDHFDIMGCPAEAAQAREPASNVVAVTPRQPPSQAAGPDLSLPLSA
jgi:hypothetical protein